MMVVTIRLMSGVVCTWKFDCFMGTTFMRVMLVIMNRFYVIIIHHPRQVVLMGMMMPRA